MRHRLRHLAARAILVLLVATPVVAEVGVAESPDGRVRPYIMGIIDDPDPVGSKWRPLSSPEAGRSILNVEGEANGDGPPSLAYRNADGLPIVAWSRSGPSGFDVVVSWHADGAWQGPVVVAGSSADELDPRVAIHPFDGSVHVVFWIADATPRVMHVEASAGLFSWTVPAAVSPPGEIAARPAATVFQGKLAVVYESHTGTLGGTPRQIMYAERSDGEFWAGVLAGTMHDGPNWPEVHAGGGGVWVEWVDAPDAMAWTRREPPLLWEPVSSETFGTPEDQGYFVRGRIRAQALSAD